MSDLTSEVAVAYRQEFEVDLDVVPYDGDYLALEPRYGDLAYRTERRTFAISGAADTDSRTYDLQAGQSLVATFSPLDPSLAFSARVIDPSGEVIATAQSDGASAEQLTTERIVLRTAGTYQFDVSGVDESAGRVALDLRLNVDFESQQFTGQTNDTRSTAEDLDQRQLALGNVTVIGDITPGGQEWFSLSVDEGTRWSTAAVVPDGAQLRVLNGDGELVSQSNAINGVATIIGLVAPMDDGQTDRYWIVVDAAQVVVESIQPYRLTTRHGGLLESSLLRPTSGLADLLGQLSPDADGTVPADRFPIFAEAADVLDVQLQSVWQPAGAPDVDWNPIVRILDADGVEIASQASDPAGMINFQHAVVATGQYQVEVASPNSVGGEYLLSVTGSSATLRPAVVATTPAAGVFCPGAAIRSA